MFDLNSITEFSRCHCIGICAVLVPTNLCLATATLIGTALDRSRWLIYTLMTMGVAAAFVLLLHVITWWTIGVVMLPTFILPILATTCLAVYIYALIDRQHLKSLLLAIYDFSIAKYQQLVAN